MSRQARSCVGFEKSGRPSRGSESNHAPPTNGTYLIAEWLEHYHEKRPHQALENEPLKKPRRPGRPRTEHALIEAQIVPLFEVRCKQRLGGLLKSYSRKAA